MKRLRAILSERALLLSISRVNPLRDVIEEVLYGVRVLAWRGFARRARRAAMGSAFDDNEVFVFAGGHFKMDFAIPDEVMAPHRRDQNRRGDAFQRAVR